MSNIFSRFLYCLKRAWKEFTCDHHHRKKYYHFKDGYIVVCTRCQRATIEEDFAENMDLF